MKRQKKHLKDVSETITLVAKIPRTWKNEYDMVLEGGDFTINSDIRGFVGVSIVRDRREKELEEMKNNFFSNLKEIYGLAISEIEKKEIEDYESRRSYNGKEGKNVLAFSMIESYLKNYMGKENEIKFDEWYFDLLHSYTSELDDLDDSMVLTFISLLADAYFYILIEKKSKTKDAEFDYLMFKRENLNERIFNLIKSKRG